MTTYRDVHVDLLLDEVVRAFESNGSIKAPNWAHFAKTGRGRQRSPDQADWWSRRCAAVLRKVAMDGPIGTNHLAQAFGQRRTGASGRMPRPQVHEASFAKRCENWRMQAWSRRFIPRSSKSTMVMGTSRRFNCIVAGSSAPKGRSSSDECAHAARPQAEARAPSLERY